MKYYTAKGDKGTTKLFNCPEGARLSKEDGIFGVLGGVDELNCFVGWCRAVATRSSLCHVERNDFLSALHVLQNDLFVIQAELGGAPKRLSTEKVKRLENTIEYFSGIFPPVTSFVIPGATELGALLDVSRAVARRVERLYRREAAKRGKENPSVSAYLNRVSSMLYVFARYANYAHGADEEAPSYS